MKALKIHTFPDSCLKKKAVKLYRVGDEEKKALSEMANTMYLNNGVGLAAVQVGINKQLAVVDVGSGLIKMVNPAIAKCEGVEVGEEGCLSVPGVCVKIKRAKKVTVQFLNEYGEATQMRAEGLLARAMQHEIDHLCGVLIIDHINPLRKLFLKKKAGKARSLDKSAAI